MNQSPEQSFKELIDNLPKSGVKSGFELNDSIENKLPFRDLEAAKQRAAIRRWKLVENLDRYLIEFEANFIKTGGKIIWARNADEAKSTIVEVLAKYNLRQASLFGDSIINELDLYNQLSLEDIKLLPLKTGIEKDVALIAQADMFISDPGVILFNGLNKYTHKVIAKTRCIIAIAGINDGLQNINDLTLFLQFKNAQKHMNHNRDFSLLFGPRTSADSDSTKEIYLLIVDNGRSNLLPDKKSRQAAWCINCGSCEKACPINNVINPVSGTYESPINSVQLSYTIDAEEFQYLNRATTLCGACSDICPVKINLHGIFIHNRSKANALQLTPQKERWFYLLWKKAMLRKSKFNFGTFKSNHLLMETIYSKIWGSAEITPPFAKKTFNEIWKEKNKQ